MILFGRNREMAQNLILFSATPLRHAMKVAQRASWTFLLILLRYLREQEGDNKVEDGYSYFTENMFWVAKRNCISIYANLNKFCIDGCFWNWSARNCLNSNRSSSISSPMSTWLI